MIKFFLDQHGCAKNQVDGELLISYLEKAGYVQTSDPNDAGLIVVNTCGFIESAKKESLDSLIRARRDFPKAKIVLAGCLAERYAGVFAGSLSEADGIFGNGDLAQITQTVESLFAGKRPVASPPQTGVSSGERRSLLSLPGSAYVKITEGCDNCCSFCAIPLIRGSLRSRSIPDIIAEIQGLLARGIFEINLVGQDLAAFGTEGGNVWESQGHSPLASLLDAVSSLPGDFWLRLLYIHPDHFPLDILDCAAKDQRILPYFDIPFQSGDDRILRAMNRAQTAEDYARLADTIRQTLGTRNTRRPVLRTTFLTGFPGETDEEAERTEAFLRRIQPDWAGVFVYSREEGTPAARLKPQTHKKIAKERAKRLEELQAQITRERLCAYTGTEQEVLIEEVIPPVGESSGGFAIGRAWFQAPEIDGSVVVSYDTTDKDATEALTPGKRAIVRITGSSDVDLQGDVV
ncbi:MAG: 30S ribosomal protein S12 methylthiotransferase RimO [Treponema sp.]|nr:30S ribosomal protein S12 methylthiotransferase RimO [Treponema sp.]